MAPIIYSDAEGTGAVAAVAVFPDGRCEFALGRVPRAMRRQMRARKTQIIAFELIAATMAALTFAIPYGGRSVIYVDNTVAVSCLVKSFSRQPDLNVLAGALSVELASGSASLDVKYVPSKLNLADAPSRGSLTELARLGAQEVPAVMPAWHLHSDRWLPWRM